MKTAKGKPEPNTMHDMKKQSPYGHKSWVECASCGTAKHTGFWWLAGYKSKEQPHCTPNNIEAWKSRAAKCTTDDYEGL